MTLPVNLTYGTVTGRIIYPVGDTSDPDTLPDAVPAQGNITFTAKVNLVKDSAAKTILVPVPVVCPLDAAGYLTSPGDITLRAVTLVAADNPDINPTGWPYTVTFNLVDVPYLSKLAPFDIVVLAGTTIDLADYIPTPGSPVVSVAQSVALAAQAAASAAAAAGFAEQAIGAADAGAAAANASAQVATTQAGVSTTKAAAALVSQTAAAGSATAADGSKTTAAAQVPLAAAQVALATAQAAAAAGSVTSIGTAIGGMAIVATVPAPGNMVLFAVVDTAGHLSWIQVGLDGHPTPAAAALIDAALATLTTGRITAAIGALPVAQIIGEGSGLAYVIVDQAGRKSEMQLDLTTGRFVGPFIDRVSAIAATAGAAAAATVVVTATAPITCWGDSKTAAGSGYGDLIPAELGGTASQIFAIGGQGSQQIAARQGGFPAVCKLPNDLIPASGPVTLTSISIQPYTNTSGTGTSSGHGTIAGVPGTLTRDNPSDVTTFTRDSAGVAVWCSPTAMFIPDQGSTNRGRISVFWPGRNSVLTNSPEDLMYLNQMMVNYLTSAEKRFLFLEVTPQSTEIPGTAARTQVDAYNALLRKTWPLNTVPVGPYLRGPGLADAGITPTAQDTIDIGNSVTPVSLRVDPTHENLAGRTVTARLVANTLRAKGWV